jgi:hypothetical protein
MTEEDQKLVALAALHGARFTRRKNGYWLAHSQDFSLMPTLYTGKYTIARAAEHYLHANGLRSDADHKEYQLRTCLYTAPQNIDPEFIASVLA